MNLWAKAALRSQKKIAPRHTAKLEAHTHHNLSPALGLIGGENLETVKVWHGSAETESTAKVSPSTGIPSLAPLSQNSKEVIDSRVGIIKDMGFSCCADSLICFTHPAQLAKPFAKSGGCWKDDFVFTKVGLMLWFS